jgi:hypothetical protein
MIMRVLAVLIVMIQLFGCAGGLSTDVSQTGPRTAEKSAAVKPSDASAPARPVKSPHGYIIDKDYEPGRFGGFVGDCSDDKNWPYYWQCMSENAGNGGFK